MHVPAEMAEQMLPLQPQRYNIHHDSGAVYSPLFKIAIHLVDPAGRVWKVQYEGSCYKDQKHPRLTRGWRDFIRSHEVQIGERAGGWNGWAGGWRLEENGWVEGGEAGCDAGPSGRGFYWGKGSGRACSACRCCGTVAGQLTLVLQVPIPHPSDHPPTTHHTHPHTPHTR